MLVDCLMQVYRIGFLVTSLPVNCNLYSDKPDRKNPHVLTLLLRKRKIVLENFLWIFSGFLYHLFATQYDRSQLRGIFMRSC